MEPAEAWRFYCLPLKSSLYGLGTIKRKGFFVGVVSILGDGVLFSLPQVLLCTVRSKHREKGKRTEEWTHSAENVSMFPKVRTF